LRLAARRFVEWLFHEPPRSSDRTPSSCKGELAQQLLPQLPRVSVGGVREPCVDCYFHVLWGVGPSPMDLYGASTINSKKVPADRPSADSHLRSTKAVKGYHIDAADGEIGHVEDFIVDPEDWSIRYMDVSTRNWLPGKHVLIAPEWIEKVSWVHSRVSVDLLRASVKGAPEYVESRPITREYERQLHAYYARHPYWLRETVHA
jgi:hypothetical protein